jgi:hypothetical protein
VPCCWPKQRLPINRFRAIAEQDNPFLPSYDQLALFRSGRKFDGLAGLAAFEQERRETLAWLDSLPESVGSRTGRHEEPGVLSFNQLLNEFAFHDLGHIRQIIELYRSHAFYPNMASERRGNRESEDCQADRATHTSSPSPIVGGNGVLVFCVHSSYLGF